MYLNIEQLKTALRDVLDLSGGHLRILDEKKLRGGGIDELVYCAVLGPDEEMRDISQWIVRESASQLHIIPSSIQPLYEAMGRGETGGFTVPAINIRGLTYHVASAVFRAAMRGEVGPLIFEIARSEIGYTAQRPSEYACAVLAAAIRTGYSGPVFLQGDHFQVSAKKFAKEPQAELKGIRTLIKEAINAGFFNIDIDSSTLVDLSRPTIEEQQKNNFTIAAELTSLIRDIEPDGVTVSVGGEIGEVGGKNSTVQELTAFMDGYIECLARLKPGAKGLSKISVQTGTTHGGVPLPDGTIAKVSIDFGTLEELSRAARKGYGMAGAVQHGASTLPDEAFGRFPQVGTAEIHLATGFQNMIYDHECFPAELREQIYSFISSEFQDERKLKDTDEQFIYKTRKKGFGPFKGKMWNLPPDRLEAIGRSMEEKFYFLFDKLNVLKTGPVIGKYVVPVRVPVPGVQKGKLPDKIEQYEGGE